MTIDIFTAYTLLHCYKCGVAFAVAEGFKNALKRDRNDFWCPNGHIQHFFGETEVEKLKKKLQREQEAHERTQAQVRTANRRADTEKRSHSATKGRLTKMGNRIKKGVCPFCNRHFANLQGHMETKHPEEKCH